MNAECGVRSEEWNCTNQFDENGFEILTDVLLPDICDAFADE